MATHFEVRRADEGTCSTCHLPANWTITARVKLKFSGFDTSQVITVYQCETCKAELAQELKR